MQKKGYKKMKDDIKCLKCGNDSSYLGYYESGIYLKTSEIVDDVVVTFDSEPQLDENDAGAVCNNCGVHFDIEFESDGKTIKRLIRK